MTDIPTASVESALLLAEGLARYRANGWPTEEIGGTSPRAAAIICALASEVLRNPPRTGSSPPQQAKGVRASSTCARPMTTTRAGPGVGPPTARCPTCPPTTSPAGPAFAASTKLRSRRRLAPTRRAHGTPNATPRSPSSSPRAASWTRSAPCSGSHASGYDRSPSEAAPRRPWTAYAVPRPNKPPRQPRPTLSGAPANASSAGAPSSACTTGPRATTRIVDGFTAKAAATTSTPASARHTRVSQAKTVLRHPERHKASAVALAERVVAGTAPPNRRYIGRSSKVSAVLRRVGRDDLLPASTRPEPIKAPYGCPATNLNGTACSRRVWTEGDLCHIHAGQAARRREQP